ncbi:MAG: hypothetical protein AAGC68_13245 [Verrucomicrobiota bacterium]
MKFLIQFLSLLLILVSGSLGQDLPSERELLKRLEDMAPEIHEELRRIEKTDPRIFREELEAAGSAFNEYDRVRGFSETGAAAFWEMYRIDFEAVWYSDKIASLGEGEPEKASELRKELKSLISKSFDSWLVYEEEKLEKVRADLRVAESNLRRHRKEKEAIVEGDTDELIEESRRYWKK